LKITPTNQSLILAGEPGGSRGAPVSVLGQASRLVAGGGGLQRVTILSAHSTATVVVQADYFSHDDSSAVTSRPEAPTAPSYDALAPAATNAITVSRPATRGRSATISSYLKPIELYMRTQRGLDDAPKAGLLDVLA
jgi:hypothetical protein